MRLRRSCLAVPGSSEKMLAKAAELPADQVFLDLEDAVSPLEKEAARGHRRRRAEHARLLGQDPGGADQRRADPVVPARRDRGRHRRGPQPRLHHGARRSRTPRRCTSSITCSPSSSSSAASTTRSGSRRRSSRRGARSTSNEIATATDRIETLIFGPGDYAANIGVAQLTIGSIDPTYPGDQWHFVISAIVTTARAHGLQAIDGPFTDIKDTDTYRTLCHRARSGRLRRQVGAAPRARSRSPTRCSCRPRSSSTPPAGCWTPTTTRPRSSARARSCTRAR